MIYALCQGATARFGIFVILRKQNPVSCFRPAAIAYDSRETQQRRTAIRTQKTAPNLTSDAHIEE